MRIAYADPPYIGQARRHYGHHPDYAGEVDHGALILRLLTFDAWALSCSMKSLPALMRLCPIDVLTLAWVKPIAPPLGDHRHYSWEPVIVKPARQPANGYVHTHLVLSPPQFTFRPRPDAHVIGEKPAGFVYWLLDNLGVDPDDEFHDLFPGSGAVTRAWDAWRNQGRLALL